MKRLQPFEIRPVPQDELSPLPELTHDRILERTPAGRWKQRLVQVCVIGAALAPGTTLSAEDAAGAPDAAAAADASADAAPDVGQDTVDAGFEPEVVGCMCAPAPGSGLGAWSERAAALLGLLAPRRGGPKRG